MESSQPTSEEDTSISSQSKEYGKCKINANLQSIHEEIARRFTLILCSVWISHNSLLPIDFWLEAK